MADRHVFRCVTVARTTTILFRLMIVAFRRLFLSEFFGILPFVADLRTSTRTTRTADSVKSGETSTERFDRNEQKNLNRRVRKEELSSSAAFYLLPNQRTDAEQ